MGRSGARKGYKVFSINTTIRNPKRNVDFLKIFKKYDGLIMNDEISYLYLFDLVKNGIYQFINIPLSVKHKIDNEQKLTSSEVLDAIKDNPQATGLHGRVMTQLRSLKDQGFLIFEPAGKRLNKISLTKLGNDLILNKDDGSTVFTKAMIGMQANSPLRSSLYNKSVPFLNTLFVINEVNRLWELKGNEGKGILRHEFGAFVLSMKDCNYKNAAAEIIKYREKFRYEANQHYIEQYLKNNDILELEYKSVTVDYPDEVFRKFEMTGLLVDRGMFNYRYISFSDYNIEKIKIILERYKDYRFIEFDNQKDYYHHLENIDIPWDNDELIRKKVVESKSKALGLAFDAKIDLRKQEDLIDQMFYRKALDNAISKIDYELLKNEFKIITGRSTSKSQFADLAEPLRLEYLLALLLGKLYGTKRLVSNIIYGEDGRPLHYAPAGKSDIILYDEEGSYIFEPTMQRSRTQLLNNETTNIVRHVDNEKKSSGLDFRVSMVAPVVHRDVADYFLYQVNQRDIKMLPMTISKATQVLLESKNIKMLNMNFDMILEDFKKSDLTSFVDRMNDVRL
ncbi:AlwI family type II restriction endonuclease [Acholeplasma laidlawii]|uniref:AlwI family type II restriction endonuclease n=1 Tax=Acholeplasma laidlawii TaxID=2148 RepID=UPI0018C24E2D|nr:AlwI family type II restriction endonuclease [Acholeplasma laidlawii]MBG0762776.1 AlwI family type II restriction endonuclease [Acholeplasma laidlawii]